MLLESSSRQSGPAPSSAWLERATGAAEAFLVSVGAHARRDRVRPFGAYSARQRTSVLSDPLARPPRLRSSAPPPTSSRTSARAADRRRRVGACGNNLD